MGSSKKRVVLALSAAELPERMRGEFEPDDRVQVTIEKDPARSWDDLVEAIQAYQRANPHPVTSDEAVSRIRTLRDEWE